MFLKSIPNHQVFTLPLLLGLAAGGCAQLPVSPQAAPADSATSESPRPLLLVIVQRDRRLPDGFTAAFAQRSRQLLPAVDVKVGEELPDPETLAAAEWIMTLRATRLVPNYSFQPAADNLVNGANDCLWGGGLGLGLFLAPCEFYGDGDFLEATIRNSAGQDLHTYRAEADAHGFVWLLLPSAWLWHADQDQRWQTLTDSVYRQAAGDGLFGLNAIPAD